MARWKTGLLIAIGLAVLAGSLRFFRLGDWPFRGDELDMLEEGTAWFKAEPIDPASQAYRLPRLIPVSYGPYSLGYELFGGDEFGSRICPALLGTCFVLLVFFFLDQSLGRVPALATALLVALWPEHVFRSQENRFYMMAALWAALTMLAGALAVQRRSLGWGILAALAGVIAILAHTLQGMLVAGLCLAVAVVAWQARDRRLVRLLAVVVLIGSIGGGLLAFYLLPLLAGWNSKETWGYGVGHSVLAAACQLGWPIVLLAALGGIKALRSREDQDWYWLTWMMFCGIVCAVLPLAVVYHPGYVFPLYLAVLVLAGRAIAHIYEGLRQSGFRVAAYAWVVLASLLSLPELISHYSDGSRHDFRAPAQFVSKHWEPGDRLTTPSPRLLEHYLTEGIKPIGINGANPVPKLQRLAEEPGRIWIVLASGRDGMPESLRSWLGANCASLHRVCGRRFDYYEYVTEVYLLVPPTAVVTQNDEPQRRLHAE